jgi:hypothetical protein
MDGVRALSAPRATILASIQEMPLYTILHRWSETPIALVEASDFPRALALAVEQRVKLLYANLEGTVAPWAALRGADLRGADLSHAELACANLEEADLRTSRGVGTYFRRALLGRADLRQADLRQADLRRASLEGAKLVGADLRGALLFGARLGGAVLDWRWSVVPLELLRQDRRASQQGSKLLAALAFEEDEQPFAWLKVLLNHREAADWALAVLARHIRAEDNAPELLRKLTADAVPVARAAQTSPMLWTRRLQQNQPPLLLDQG